jgi:hypothetical protein
MKRVLPIVLLFLMAFAHSALASKESVGFLTTEPKAELDILPLDADGKFLDLPSREQFERHGSSVPDAYGYIFRDSSEPDGPAFEWVNISMSGTPLSGMGDDDYAGPITLPWPFLFYGEEYQEIYVSSNGYLSFGTGHTDYGNDPIPSSSTPNNIIALFWDDLNPSSGGTIYVGESGDDWVCQFQSVREYGGTGTLTAEVILSQDGSIVLQYSSLDNLTISEESIGCESADGQAGLGISFDATPPAYPSEELAIQIGQTERNASVEGVVSDSETGLPVEGARVRFGGIETMTDPLGSYSLPLMWAGTHELRVSCDYFMDFTETVALVEGGNVRDAQLDPTPFPSGLVGYWTFDDSEQLTHAAFGNDLELSGSHTAVDGPEEGDGAITIGSGSFYRCYHDIAANGAGNPDWVNDFTIVMDVRLPSIGQYYSLYQTNYSNSNDADWFVNPSGAIGVIDTGYSEPVMNASEWYRLAISVSLGNHYDYYLDGQLLHMGGAQTFEGRFALYPSDAGNQVLFFADESGEDNALDVAQIVLFDRDLSAGDLAEMGGYGHEIISPEVPYMEAYLQSPTATSLYVCWHSAASTASVVEYGTTEALGSTVTGDAHNFSSETIWHWAQLTGLTPDTEYFYRCVSDTATSATRNFRTQPADDDLSGHVRFMVYGDTRTDFTAHRMVTDAFKEKVEELYGEDLHNQVNLVFNVGDIVSTGSVLSQYQTEHFSPISPFANNIPYMISIGNHEGEAAHFYNYMKYEDFGGSEGERYYSFRISSVLFIALNSNTQGNTQLSWLNAELTAAQADPVVSMVFAFLHHPGRSEVWPDGNTSWVQNSVIPMLETYDKVEMLTYGHSHNYERGESEASGLRLMLNGGGGSALDRWGMYGNQENYPELKRSYDHYCYSIIDVDLTDNSYTAETYSLGHTDLALDNASIDSWHHKRNQPAPDAPVAYAPAGTVPIPVHLCASPISNDEGLSNSHFQVTSTQGDYATPLVNSIRDAVDIYGDTGAPNYEGIDLNAGTDLQRFAVDSGLASGQTYWWRVRYRDENLCWSSWSEESEFMPMDLLSHRTDFVADIQEGPAPLFVRFTDTSTRQPQSWEWDFDGDGSTDSVERDPSWSYAEPGLYTVTLVANYGATQETEEKVAYIAVDMLSPEVENLQITISGGQVHLVWDEDARFDHYNIYGAMLPYGNYALIGTSDDAAHSLSVAATKYCYRVTGVWTEGQ